jgi:NDP-sugar pyrophosphorylase family protein
MAIDWSLSAFSADLFDRVILETNPEGRDAYLKWAKNSDFKKNIEIFVDPLSTSDNPTDVLNSIEMVVDHYSIKRPLLIIAPDNLFRANLDGMITSYKDEDARIAVYQVPNISDASKYGNVKMKGDRLAFCIEKPVNPISSIIRTSCEIWGPKVFFHLRVWNSSVGADKVGDFVNYLIQQRLDVRAHKFEGIWIDIGNRKDLEEARKIFK